MEESDFEGTLVLEKLARINKLEEFMDAVDSSDIKSAKSLMKEAGIDSETIEIVLTKISDPFEEH